MDTGVAEVKGVMEQKYVNYPNSFWLKPILSELRRQHVSIDMVKKDLNLSDKEIESLDKDGPYNIIVYLNVFDYLGLRLKIVNEIGKSLEPIKPFDISKAANLSKIRVQDNYINMDSLYTARTRAIYEMESLGKSYRIWGEISHRRLQIAADNVMLINIIEDLFKYGRRPDRS